MRRIVELMLVVLAVTGCATTASSLRARFSREVGCPESQVGVRERGGNVYLATGCGRSREYVCGGVSGLDSAHGCQERGLPQQAPASEQRRFPEPMNPMPGPGAN
ncbi:MAG: hypothetical protein R3B13_20635 [Polyangiaceae bacterium]